MFANTKKVLSFLPKAGTIPTPGPGEYNVPSDMRVAGRAASKKPPSKDGEERTSFGLEPRGFLVGTFGTKGSASSPRCRQPSPRRGAKKHQQTKHMNN